MDDAVNRFVSLRQASIAAVVVLLGLALAAPAQAARIVTWKTDSRFVDPQKEPFNGPPPGVPERRNALRVNVYLPDGYDGDRRYPVLYLLHGHGDGYDYWSNPERGDLRDTARNFPGIIVMPEGARSWYANWWHDGRRRPGWERYHLDELMSLVERRLEIRRARRWHAIAGLSMGGEGAAFYASQRPGYFGSLAVFSGVLSIQRPEWPALFDTQGERHVDVFGDPELQRFYWTGHNPTALVDNLRHTRTYVTVGDGTPGSLEEAENQGGAASERYLRLHSEDFVAAAREAGVDTTYRPRQGIHDWAYWRQHLRDAIQNWGFFKRVEEHPRSWTYETVAKRSEAHGFRFSFRRAPEALERFRRTAHQLRGAGAGKVRVRTPCGDRFTVRMPFERTVRCKGSAFTRSSKPD